MLRGRENACRNLEFPRNFGIGRWSWEGDRLEDLRLFPGETGNPGMRFCISGMNISGTQKMQLDGFNKIPQVWSWVKRVRRCWSCFWRTSKGKDVVQISETEVQVL